jgi:two-component system, cell cycle response regulator DivK
MSHATGQVPQRSSRSPQWILIAEDNDLIRAAWIEVLTRAGYRTIQARNGREALEVTRTLVPHLILLDLEMPQMSGEDLVHHLRGSPVLAQIPVLIVSGFLAGRIPSRLGLNVVGALSKPIGTRDLLQSVRSALAHGGPRRRV